MKIIGLTKGYEAIVDDADFEWMSAFKWYAQPSTRGSVYAYRSFTLDGIKQAESMHRKLMGVTSSDVQIDHRNHNGLDNRRGNLRLATRLQNGRNRQKKKVSSSVYKGVAYWSVRGGSNGRWGAYIRIKGKTKHLGFFPNEREAALAYNDAAMEAHGDFACLNQVRL